MSAKSLVELLLAIEDLLRGVGEARVADGFRDLAVQVRDAHDDETRRETILLILGLYGGMGSFQDFVLQNAAGVLPEQTQLDVLRTALYKEARRELT